MTCYVLLLCTLLCSVCLTRVGSHVNKTFQECGIHNVDAHGFEFDLSDCPVTEATLSKGDKKMLLNVNGHMMYGVWI